MRHSIAGRWQSGDTIIEVLIAIAVVSGVLGTTYAIMNRNHMIVRTNQERTEASKLAQRQIEMLKGFISQHGEAELEARGLIARAADSRLRFCMYQDSTGPQLRVLDKNDHSGAYGPTADDPMDYPADCSQGLFHAHMVQNKIWSEPGPVPNRCSYGFTATVRWFGLVSDRNEVSMAYKTGYIVPAGESLCNGALTP